MQYTPIRNTVYTAEEQLVPFRSQFSIISKHLTMEFIIDFYHILWIRTSEDTGSKVWWFCLSLRMIFKFFNQHLI